MDKQEDYLITQEDLDGLEYKLFKCLLDILEGKAKHVVRASYIDVGLKYLKMKGNYSLPKESPLEAYPGLEDHEKNFNSIELPYQ